MTIDERERIFTEYHLAADAAEREYADAMEPIWAAYRNAAGPAFTAYRAALTEIRARRDQQLAQLTDRPGPLVSQRKASA